MAHATSVPGATPIGLHPGTHRPYTSLELHRTEGDTSLRIDAYTRTRSIDNGRLYALPSYPHFQRPLPATSAQPPTALMSAAYYTHSDVNLETQEGSSRRINLPPPLFASFLVLARLSACFLRSLLYFVERVN